MYGLGQSVQKSARTLALILIYYACVYARVTVYTVPYVNKHVGVLASAATCAANAASIDFVLPISRGMYSPFHRTGAAAYFNLTDCRCRSDGEWSWCSLRPFSGFERISSRQSGEQTRKLFDG